ncbi:MAG: hypothetical protein P8172_17070 [Gammaproteobacteria bacterium]
MHDRRDPPGVEVDILRRMPLIFLLGTAAPAVFAATARLWFARDPGLDVAKRIASIDIFAIALVVTFWTAVLTVSIACFIVFVMKGPGYVADAYHLNDAPRPAARPYHRSE